MAGLSSSTTTFPSRPNSLSLSSFHSNKLFGLRLNFPTSSSYLEFAISVSRNSIAARYGGGGGGFSRPGSGDFRRSRQGNSEEDQALDISSISSENVRLIDDKQNMIGIVSKSEALQRAEDAELDLVLLSPDADPPVVRLMDYNYNIDVHDYSVRLKAAQKFLKDGDKVKVIVNLKGRESDFRNNAIELIRRFQNDIGELAVEESKSFRERSMTLVLVPNKAVVQKAPESPKKKEKTAPEVSAGV